MQTVRTSAERSRLVREELPGRDTSARAARALRIVAPVYFDVPAFKMLREQTLSTLAHDESTEKFELTFAVVDDSAGRDEQIGELAAFGDVSVIVPPFNIGHQRALVYALRTSLPHLGDDDVVVTLDSDGEDRPEDIPILLSALNASGGQQIVLAQRTRRHAPLVFKLLYACYRVFFRTLTGSVIQSGNFAAFRAGSVRRVLTHPYFNLCYSSSFVSLEIPIVYVPCERGPRYAGESRMGYTRLMMHGLSMLMPFLDRIALRSLVAFSVTMFTGIILSVVVVCVRFFTSTAVPGWATYTLLLLLVISFVALGNFVILFAIFSQTRGTSLAALEEG